MFDSLLGADMPLAVRFFLAFLVVLGLIGATAWAVQRFGRGRLGSGSVRGRQPRLAVIDYASVDGRRRLILVRRDNVEHLLMIGGPSDIVVEPNIVRALAAARDVPTARAPAALDMMPPLRPAPPLDMIPPRPMPLPETTGNGSWPLQPEPSFVPAPMASRPPRLDPLPEVTAAWPLQTQVPPAETPLARPQRDTLVALAEELAPRPAPSRNRPSGTARPQAVEPRGEPRMPPQPPMSAEAVAAADQSLAEMAHRLEAALRKPSAKVDGRDTRAAALSAAAPAATAPPPPQSLATVVEAEADTESAPPPVPPGAVPPPTRPMRVVENTPRAEANEPEAGKAVFDSLEQEMASLLGRPTNKT